MVGYCWVMVSLPVPSGTLHEEFLNGMLMALSSSAIGLLQARLWREKGQDDFCSEAVLFLGVALLFSPKCLGSQLYASQDPLAWDFGFTATQLNWLKLKLSTKINLFLFMFTSCHDQA